jgi:hypothetical protein
MKIPYRVGAKISNQLRRYQTVLVRMNRQEVGEADTSMIVADMLSDVFGYRKIDEIVSVAGDMSPGFAVSVGETLRFIVAVCSPETNQTVSLRLTSTAARMAADWALLTNGHHWQAFKVNEQAYRIPDLEVDVVSIDPTGKKAIEFFGSFSRDVFTAEYMQQLFCEKQAMSRHAIAALLLSDPVVTAVRRGVRKRVYGYFPSLQDVREVIAEQVIKRELIEN